MDVQHTLVDRAELLMELGRHQEALPLLQRALAESPSDTHILCQIAVVSYHLGQYNDTLAWAEKAVASDPESAWAHRLRAIALEVGGRRADAVEAAYEAVKCAPHSPVAWSVLVDALLADGRTEEADAAARSLLELAPDQPTAHGSLADVLSSQQRWGAAEAALRTALSAEPDAVHLAGLGDMLREQARLPEALDAYHASLRASPTAAHVRRRYESTLEDHLRVSYYGTLIAPLLTLLVTIAGGFATAGLVRLGLSPWAAFGVAALACIAIDLHLAATSHRAFPFLCRRAIRSLTEPVRRAAVGKWAPWWGDRRYMAAQLAAAAPSLLVLAYAVKDWHENAVYFHQHADTADLFWALLAILVIVCASFIAAPPSAAVERSGPAQTFEDRVANAEVASSDPDKLCAYIELVAAGGSAHAARSLARLFDIAPDSVAYHRAAAAVCLLTHRRPDDAEPHCQQWLQRVPGSPDAWRMLAKIRAAQGRRPDAIDALARALLHDPRDADTRDALRRATMGSPHPWVASFLLCAVVGWPVLRCLGMPRPLVFWTLVAFEVLLSFAVLWLRNVVVLPRVTLKDRAIGVRDCVRDLWRERVAVDALSNGYFAWFFVFAALLIDMLALAIASVPIPPAHR